MKLSMKNDWRGLFAPWILERGKLYFESGAVLSIDKTKDGYKAVVEGSEDYNVSIDVDECGEFIDADCDCPYSEAGNYCKHEAAVLYAIENEFDDYEMSSGKESIEQPLESLDSVISSMSENLFVIICTLFIPTLCLRGIVMKSWRKPEFIFQR